MNRKIAGMVRFLLPVFLLASLSVSIQAVAAVDTGGVPAGNSVVARSNGAMTMSGLVQTGTCSLSADNTTMIFKPMSVKDIQSMGNGSTISSFDTVLNLNNCMGNKLYITISSANITTSDGNYASLRSEDHGYIPTGLLYSVLITVDSGFCQIDPIQADTCSASSMSYALDGRRPFGGIAPPYYQPDSNSYRMKLTTTITISSTGTDLILPGRYDGMYTYTVSYQ
ncbi:TPA: hypothetical protein G8C29_004788 [Salmonella enterica]|uniref:Type 1 fimbrial protein n=1 Tax=Salmonella enterica TaxID=28901 RepID=A0A749C1M8_SALER|nr:hypothetical protein [Salmonella enterica]EEM7558665.1 hypothetical protein [Salmonella enterica subsp. enterica serovar Infantis]HAF5507106.1 hypothetical protein [Salmonella enterica]